MTFKINSNAIWQTDIVCAFILFYPRRMKLATRISSMNDKSHRRAVSCKLQIAINLNQVAI